jgi:hypothetical protein
VRLGLTRAAQTDLSRWLRSGGQGRLQATGAAAGLTPDGGGAAQAAAGSPVSSSATPNRASGHETLREKVPKLRGGHEKITWGLGREGGAPEKRIGGEGRAPAGRSSGGAVEEWRDVGAWERAKGHLQGL